MLFWILLSKTQYYFRQSLTTVLLRTPITQMIFFNQGIIFFYGHNGDSATLVGNKVTISQNSLPVAFSFTSNMIHGNLHAWYSGLDT